MKKKTVILLCLTFVTALSLSLAACGSKGENPPSADQTSPSVQEPEPSVMPPVSDDGPVVDLEPGGDDLEDEFTGWSDEMNAIRNAILDEFDGEYWPSMPVPAEALEGLYGVSADLYDDYLAEMPLMSAHVDTLVIIKAKDGKAEAVENALEAYHQNLLGSTAQYPSNLGKIQGSKVARIGNYVCFVLLGGDVMEQAEKGDDAVISYCQEQNDRAIGIISANIEQ